jgi:hypothetical protein
LVCNPDAGSLFLAREKADFLRTLGLGDRISVLLNRVDQALAIPAAKAGQFLGLPVAAKFSDDSFEVERAVAEASSVVGGSRGKNSKLAREYRAFARRLVQASRGGSQVEMVEGMRAVA